MQKVLLGIRSKIKKAYHAFPSRDGIIEIGRFREFLFAVIIYRHASCGSVIALFFNRLKGAFYFPLQATDRIIAAWLKINMNMRLNKIPANQLFSLTSSLY